MKSKICILLAIASALTVLSSCAKAGQAQQTVSDTEIETESESVTESLTESESEILTLSDTESAIGETTPTTNNQTNTGYTGTWSRLTDTQTTCDFIYEMQEIERLYPSAVLKENKTNSSAERTNYLRKITFLGDSTTNGMRLYGVLPDGIRTKQVWYGPHGTITLSNVNVLNITYPDEGVEMPIIDAARKKKPEIMIITLGVNGISFMNESSFKLTYAKLIDNILSVSPKTKIILQSIYPIAKTYAKQGSINQYRIARANRWIAEIAVNKNLYYLNTALALALDDGYLPSSLQNGDGLHPNKTCYQKILEYIVTHPIPEYAHALPETQTETEKISETESITESVTESATETESETESDTESATESESVTETESTTESEENIQTESKEAT